MFKNIIFSFTFIFLLASSWVCNANPRANNKIDTISYTNNYQLHIEEVTLQQLKAQIILFKEALDQFGATSPKQAVTLWAKGIKNRNGVLQYSVLCDELKNKFISDRGPAPTSFWIIGVSSPWLDKYEIAQYKKINDSSYEITLKLYWVAVDYNKSEKKILTVVNQGDKWCIENIR